MCSGLDMNMGAGERSRFAVGYRRIFNALPEALEGTCRAVRTTLFRKNALTHLYQELTRCRLEDLTLVSTWELRFSVILCRSGRYLAFRRGDGRRLFVSVRTILFANGIVLPVLKRYRIVSYCLVPLLHLWALGQGVPVPDRLDINQGLVGASR